MEFAQSTHAQQDFTDCPLCKSLCLGSVILPCGHLVCRKCLRQTLADKGENNACPFCGHRIPRRQGQTISELAEQLGKDLIFEKLVAAKLSCQDNGFCLVCPDKSATTVCLDCGEMYCDRCSKAHRQMGVSKDHVQQCLTEIVRSSPSTAGSSLSAGSDGSSASQASQSSTQQPDTAFLPVPQNSTQQSDPASSPVVQNSTQQSDPTSSPVVQNSTQQSDGNPLPVSHHSTQQSDSAPLPDSQNRTQRSDGNPLQVSHHSDQQSDSTPLLVTQNTSQQPTSAKPPVLQNSMSASYPDTTHPGQSSQLDSLKQQAERFREGASQLDVSAGVVEANVAQLHQVKKRLERHKLLLTTYISHLEDPEDALRDNVTTMQPRLKRILEDCRPPQAALATVTKHINSLMQAEPRSGERSPKPTTSPLDPKTLTPRRLFVTRPSTPLDKSVDGPWISSIATTRDGRLVMADQSNRMIKVAVMSNPASGLQGVAFDVIPKRVTIVRDGQVAVTVNTKSIYFVDITERPTVASTVHTQREYQGLSSVVEDDTLVVSCPADEDGPASVDVISRQGIVLRRVVDSTTLTALSRPLNLHVISCREVLISDHNADAVFRVDLDNGRLIDKLINLKCPRQVAADKAGNWYITSRDGQCVIVATPGGPSLKLLSGREHGDATRVCPLGLCLTDWGVVVTWRGKGATGYTAVAGYRLVQAPSGGASGRPVTQ